MQIARTILSGLPDSRIIPPANLFLHQSTIHGRHHVGRVMIHALRLIEATGLYQYTLPLWAAVYIHDLSRTHDNKCYAHGPRATARINRGEFDQIFSEAHLTRRSDIRESIITAVWQHSQPGELPRTDRAYPLTAFLKDADGLDRVRLGDGGGDLDPSYLRFSASADMIPFAQKLFDATKHINDDDALFENIFWVARDIESRD